MKSRKIPALCAIFSTALVACATPGPAPEARVQTVTVKVPVAQPCQVKLGPEPTFPDTPDAVRAVPAGDLRDLVKLLLAGRELRDAWIGEQAAAIQACAK